MRRPKKDALRRWGVLPLICFFLRSDSPCWKRLGNNYNGCFDEKGTSEDTKVFVLEAWHGLWFVILYL